MQITKILIIMGAFILGTIQFNIYGQNLGNTRVYGGTPVQECGWASTVALRSNGGLCTGTLIHPQVVMYAAHCGKMNEAIFGENMNTGKKISISRSEIFKTFNNSSPGKGEDFAIAILSQAVDFVRPTPILMGCEIDVLKPGTEVRVVGFGKTERGSIGVKHEVSLPFNQFIGNEASVGGNGKDSCQGDSGGPVFVKLSGLGSEDQWRVFGITSYGGACGSGGRYSLAHIGVEWMEEETGFDLTPCHDTDGTWNPGPECRAFAKNPEKAIGEFSSMCGDEELTNFVDTCGAAFEDVEEKESEAPIIAMIENHELVQLQNGESSRSLNFSFSISDASTLKEVSYDINGSKGILNSDSEIYDFSFTAVEGSYDVKISAEDAHGNIGEKSIQVNVYGYSPDSTTETTKPNNEIPDSNSDSNSGNLEPVRITNMPGCTQFSENDLWALLIFGVLCFFMYPKRNQF